MGRRLRAILPALSGHYYTTPPSLSPVQDNWRRCACPFVYRVLDSKALAYPSKESVKDYICRTGKLPAVPVQTRPVRRSKPRFHWCSYDSWSDPSSTREALQIRKEWSDCRLRARLPTRTISRSS